jgi:endo-1,4-beta-xylanase
MDVPVGEMSGTRAQKLEEQKRLTHDIVAACVAVSACSGVTFWGFTDRYSWLNDPDWSGLRGRRPHYPLPFDADYRPKPMAAGIAAALAGS